MKKILCILVMVFVAFPLYAGSDLASQLKIFLKKQYPWSEIELNDLRLSAEAPAGSPKQIVVEQGPPGKTTFALTYADGKKVHASASVKAFDRVVVSRRALAKDTLLQKEDLYLVSMEVGRIPKGAARTEEELLGKRLSRNIGMNVAIATNMLNDTSLVKKGQKVLLIAEDRGFSVKAPGELQQNGTVGEYVKVINLASHKAIIGLLVDERTVKVGL